MRVILGSILTFLILPVLFCGLSRFSQPEATPVEAAIQAGQSGIKIAIALPTEGQQFEAGQPVEVLSGAIDEQGITRLELLVNDEVVAMNGFVAQPGTQLVNEQTWMPSRAGPYTLKVRAYTSANNILESAPVSIIVKDEAEANETSTVIPPVNIAPLPTPTSTRPAATFTPAKQAADTLSLATATPTPASATATPTHPYLIVRVEPGLNVRQGPGTNYPVSGLLQSGQAVEILGQDNRGGGWWQIRFKAEVGWVTASSDFTTAYNTANVPIVAAPTSPVNIAEVATATPTPMPTPPPQPTDDIVFTVDRAYIRGGECVTVFWNTSNVKEVYYNNHGVAGENQQVVECPTATEHYELRVVKQDGWNETRKLIVEVEGAHQIRVIHMEFDDRVDFDSDGKVSDSGDDFTWIEDDGERRFRKQDSDDDLRLVPIGPFKSLYEVRRSDCDYALKHLDDHRSIKPFPDLVACIRTDERRVGKIRFENNDKEVEIDWIMWE